MKEQHRYLFLMPIQQLMGISLTPSMRRLKFLIALVLTDPSPDPYLSSWCTYTMHRSKTAADPVSLINVPGMLQLGPPLFATRRNIFLTLDYSYLFASPGIGVIYQRLSYLAVICDAILYGELITCFEGKPSCQTAGFSFPQAGIYLSIHPIAARNAIVKRGVGTT